MSHFTVAVITPGPAAPTQEQLAALMQPYHEYECTGTLDQYVIQVDKTDEARDDYAGYTLTRYKDSEGVLHEPYQDHFYREMTPEEKAKHGPIFGSGGGSGISWHSKDWGDGKGYRAKVRFVPEGYEEVEVPAKEVMDFREFVTYYYEYPELIKGFEDQDVTGNFTEVTSLEPEGEVVRVVKFTNPNKKWDWWTVGGRWKGLLEDRQGGQHDQLQIKDLDVMGRMAVAMGKALAEWEKLRKLMVGVEPFKTFAQFREEYPAAEEARAAYWDQPAVAVMKSVGSTWDISNQIDILSMEREDYGNMRACAAIGTFAYLKDGKWQERGEMGWFGAHSEEMPKGAWEQHWVETILGCDHESWITIVDCHI